MPSCRSCGATLGAESRFCPECGQKHDNSTSAPQNQAPGPAGQSRTINVAGENVEHSYKGESQGPARQTNVAGRDVVIVHGAKDRARDLNEYKNLYRTVLSGMQTARRRYLDADERQQLDEAGSRLLLNVWERETCEREVQAFLGIEVTAQPSELWNIGAGGRQLAQKQPRVETVEAVADYLDEFTPDTLLLWRKDFGKEWHPLVAEADLLREVISRRQERYVALLTRVVQQNKLSTAAEVLERAGRHLPPHDLNEARRTVEKAVGKQITLPKAGGAQAAPAVSPNPASVLDGVYEANGNAAIRLEIGGGVLQLKLTYPYARAGRASIGNIKLTGSDFTLSLSGHVGSFSSVLGLEGTVTKDGLTIRQLAGTIPQEVQAFKTSYVRL